MPNDDQYVTIPVLSLKNDPRTHQAQFQRFESFQDHDRVYQIQMGMDAMTDPKRYAYNLRPFELERKYLHDLSNDGLMGKGPRTMAWITYVNWNHTLPTRYNVPQRQNDDEVVKLNVIFFPWSTRTRVTDRYITRHCRKAMLVKFKHPDWPRDYRGSDMQKHEAWPTLEE